MQEFMHTGLQGIASLSTREFRSISAENPTGAKGGGGMASEGTGSQCARDLGRGWKISPSIQLNAAETAVLARIEGPAILQHWWITTVPEAWRHLILRMYWDGEESPSVEVPLGDFFASGWCKRCLVNSQPISVNPAGGFNSYWPMPFDTCAVITLENRYHKTVPVYYQFDYSLGPIEAATSRFHAQWRRSNPLPYLQPHVIAEGISGQGRMVGLYLAWQPNSNNWWGEGEVKMYLDGDTDWPTYCGTGTEDYFGGAWNWEFPEGTYATYSTPYLGMHQHIKPEGLYQVNQRFGMYRWHILDPVEFHQDFGMTIQALGWRDKSRFLPLQDDIASTLFWYQTEPHAPFPTLPGPDFLEVI